MMDKLVSEQREYFLSGSTIDVDKRIVLLKELKECVREHERDVLEALKLDLGKPEFEAFVSEIAHFYAELDYILSHLKRWSRPKRRLTPFVNFPGVSYTYRQPYGVVLIISPWNYPFDLAMVPLAYAVAAGNTVVLKPSEVSSNTSRVISKIVSSVFDERHVAVVEGGAEVAKALLAEKFDLIFYTGNPKVGRYVMECAAKNLTPVVLELGGKSPVVVWNEKDWETAVKRIVWGKCFNAGQTCIAPDYVILQKGMLDDFVSLFASWIKRFYGENVKASPYFGRIVNERHFLRLRTIIEAEKSNILFGGGFDEATLFIEPTVIKADGDSPSMQDEIFGPILPVLEMENIDDVIGFINERPEPLALYLFTSDAGLKRLFMERVRSGAFLSGDCLVHFVSVWLPFGGIGESGIGKYHGRWGFEAFTNEKAVMDRPRFLDLPIRYPPYKGWKFSFIKKLGKLLTNFGL